MFTGVMYADLQNFHQVHQFIPSSAVRAIAYLALLACGGAKSRGLTALGLGATIFDQRDDVDLAPRVTAVPVLPLMLPFG